jgi:hypothetical protein
VAAGAVARRALTRRAFEKLRVGASPQDNVLAEAVERYPGNWKKVAECFRDRNETQCEARWGE